jgi:hypothetical protein
MVTFIEVLRSVGSTALAVALFRLESRRSASSFSSQSLHVVGAQPAKTWRNRISSDISALDHVFLFGGRQLFAPSRQRKSRRAGTHTRVVPGRSLKRGSKAVRWRTLA